MKQFEDIREALIEGRDEDVPSLVSQALDAGHPPATILSQGLIAAMEVVGERFRCHDYFLPDVLMSARAMHAGLDCLQPHLAEAEIRTRGTVIIGTVQGDLHDIGKNLVGIMLQGAGFEVIDLGHDVSPEAFVEAVRRHSAGIVGMSALLTTTMPAMARVIASLKAAGLDQVKTVIGGAPVSEAFAREIGADGYGYDAARAVDLVKGFVVP